MSKARLPGGPTFNKRVLTKKAQKRECLGVHCREKPYKQRLFMSNNIGERLCQRCRNHNKSYRQDRPD